jgi:hypothetical protein
MNASNCALTLWGIWLRWNLCGFRPMWGWWVTSWWIEKHDVRRWMVHFLTDHCRHLLREWQRKWDLANTGRFVTFVSRIMSGQSCDRSHLVRFGIVENRMCVCLKDYETVDHLICHYERFGSERHRRIDTLSELDVLHDTPVRDPRKWSAIKCCLDLLGSFKVGFWSDYFPLCSCEVRNLFHRTLDGFGQQSN